MGNVLQERKKRASEAPIDEVYIIYGKSGTGKTVVASTFPKTKEAPMLYLDILEGGIGSVDNKDKELIDWVPIESFEEVDEVLEDVINGYSLVDGKKIPVKYSTIVIDSLTQLEYLIKKYLKTNSGKTSMTLQLWGQAKDSQEDVYNLLKYLHMKTGARVVAIAHEKELSDDNNPEFNTIIPSLMTSSSVSLCAKASFVWYTKIEKEDKVDENNNVVTKTSFVTYISAHPYLVTKCRKPKDFKVPEKVVDMTYDKFKKNVLDKLHG
ncbi:MAG: AAA family ATPase [Acholeplasmatales bacterium]|jgi:hypothetical protein|nr:AAA family ATPase [Acholeplasmatales bacterium]